MKYFFVYVLYEKMYVSYRICGIGYGVEDKWMIVLLFMKLLKKL